MCLCIYVTNTVLFVLGNFLSVLDFLIIRKNVFLPHGRNVLQSIRMHVEAVKKCAPRSELVPERNLTVPHTLPSKHIFDAVKFFF